MAKRPNILYFVADQLRCDSQHYMSNLAAYTPNMDKLADEAVSFRNAYCQNPVCVPSRCSFLSGLYPHATGHRTMHFLQNEDEPNILKVMKQAGYEVIWAHRNDVIASTRSKADYCDEYYDGKSKENKRDYIADGSHHRFSGKREFNKDMYSFYIGESDFSGKADQLAVECITDYLSRKKEQADDKPFFIYCTLALPHPPYASSKQWLSKIDRSKLSARKPFCKDKPSMLVQTADKMDLHHYSEERWDDIRTTYLAMVANLDDLLGQVVNSLKDNGFYDDTSIFMFSDHGDYTGNYDIVEKVQNCFENDITNVPLIIKPAKQFSCTPRITNALAELVDLNATVADMAGIDLGYVSQGKSLMDVIEGSDDHKKAVFCEGGRVFSEKQAMELGHDNPNDMYWPRLSTQYQEDGQHTKATMIRMGNLKYVKRLYEKDELYDLSTDPEELVNQIDNPEYKEQLLIMKEEMLTWYQRTADWVPNRRDAR